MRDQGDIELRDVSQYAGVGDRAKYMNVGVSTKSENVVALVCRSNENDLPAWAVLRYEVQERNVKPIWIEIAGVAQDRP